MSYPEVNYNELATRREQEAVDSLAKMVLALHELRENLRYAYDHAGYDPENWMMLDEVIIPASKALANLMLAGADKGDNELLKQ